MPLKAKEFLHCDSVYLLGDPSNPLPLRHPLVVGMWQASCRQQMQAAAEEGMATTVALQRWGSMSIVIVYLGRYILLRFRISPSTAKINLNEAK